MSHGDAISQAMSGSVQENAADAVFGRRIMHDRDDDRAAHASDLYGILRLKTKDELLTLTEHIGGVSAMGRQVLIAIYIDWVLEVEQACIEAEGEIGCEPTHQPKEER